MSEREENVHKQLVRDPDGHAHDAEGATGPAGEAPQQPLGSVLGTLGELVAGIQRWVDEHRDEIDAAIRWVADHQHEIQALGVWAGVQNACRKTGLYAPAAPAWNDIAEAALRGDSHESLEAMILSTYGPDGDGHVALQNELRSAPWLEKRRREVNEVLESFSDGRYYVTICGALPLVEGVLAGAHGTWERRVDGYRIEERLQNEVLTPNEEEELILNLSAIDMVRGLAETVWKNSHGKVGAVMTELNRHRALHGTALGWDTVENATKAVLLLAAAARFVGPLPLPSAATAPS